MRKEIIESVLPIAVFCTKQYDLNDCIVKTSNTKRFAKTSELNKKVNKIMLLSKRFLRSILVFHTGESFCCFVLRCYETSWMTCQSNTVVQGKSCKFIADLICSTKLKMPLKIPGRWGRIKKSLRAYHRNLKISEGWLEEEVLIDHF